MVHFKAIGDVPFQMHILWHNLWYYKFKNAWEHLILNRGRKSLPFYLQWLFNQQLHVVPINVFNIVTKGKTPFCPNYTNWYQGQTPKGHVPHIPSFSCLPLLSFKKMAPIVFHTWAIFCCHKHHHPKSKCHMRPHYGCHFTSTIECKLGVNFETGEISFFKSIDLGIM